MTGAEEAFLAFSLIPFTAGVIVAAELLSPCIMDESKPSREPCWDDVGILPVDEMLRQFGWAIASRPDTGPAIWKKIKDGELIFSDEGEALEQIFDELERIDKNK